jgi:hypothetical protein
MTTEQPRPAGEAGAKPAGGTTPVRPGTEAGGLRKAVFLLAGAACVTPWVSAAGGLAIGMALALLGLTAYGPQGKKLSRTLIQAGVVLLGFSIPLQEVARAGTTGLAFAAGTIVLVFGLGWLLGRWLGTEQLLSAGTAICGGSAIAATGAVISATAAQISVATATVFLLNACGVYAYPVIGQALGLSQEQFGAWAAVGIHDVAGVVAAGKAYGDVALQQATVIKLTRVLDRAGGAGLGVVGAADDCQRRKAEHGNAGAVVCGAVCAGVPGADAGASIGREPSVAGGAAGGRAGQPGGSAQGRQQGDAELGAVSDRGGAVTGGGAGGGLATAGAGRGDVAGGERGRPAGGAGDGELTVRRIQAGGALMRRMPSATVSGFLQKAKRTSVRPRCLVW